MRKSTQLADGLSLSTSRFPDLSSHHELKPVENCEYLISTSKNSHLNVVHMRERLKRKNWWMNSYKNVISVKIVMRMWSVSSTNCLSLLVKIVRSISGTPVMAGREIIMISNLKQRPEVKYLSRGYMNQKPPYSQKYDKYITAIVAIRVNIYVEWLLMCHYDERDE